MKKLRSIFLKIVKSYAFKILAITIIELMILWAELEIQADKITFIYNNF
ncbi:MAG: hypothetical protein ACI4PR_02400 [Acutalibacteraceae bacterium]